MVSNREVLKDYMEIIDSLKFAMAKAKGIDGYAAQEIEKVVNAIIPSASRVAYRLEREKWDAAGGTYES